MEALIAAGLEPAGAAPGAAEEQAAGSSQQDVSMKEAAGTSQEGSGAQNGWTESQQGAAGIIELPEGLPGAANMPGPKYK